jgi:hypothetical protein
MWLGLIRMEDGSSKVGQKFIKGLWMIPLMVVLEDIKTPIHDVLMFTLDGKGNLTLTGTTLSFYQNDCRFFSSINPCFFCRPYTK